MVQLSYFQGQKNPDQKALKMPVDLSVGLMKITFCFE